jgi:hypothetical protein
MRMHKRTFIALLIVVPFVAAVAAQRPVDAPATMTAAKPPDTVFIGTDVGRGA